VNSEMALEDVIERLCRCTWRPGSRELRNEIGGHDRATLETYLQAEIE